MNFWKVEDLRNRLEEGSVSESEKFSYLLWTSVGVVVGLWLVAWGGKIESPWEHADYGLSLVIMVGAYLRARQKYRPQKIVRRARDVSLFPLGHPDACGECAAFLSRGTP